MSTDPEDTSESDGSPDEEEAAASELLDAGLDRADYSGEFESIWEDVDTDPALALPDLEDVVRRMLEERGYVLEPSDPSAGGEEVEVLATYWAVREVADEVREGADVGDEDIAQAIADVREIYQALIEHVGESTD
jgi:hypothetical protein